MTEIRSEQLNDLSIQLIGPTLHIDTNGGKYEGSVEGDDRRRLASLALEGQPFGLTHEDVALLREEAEDEWNGEQMETGRRLLHLAKRIEALLPPKQ